MIKLEHVVLPNQYQMEFIIEGMRNPLNSWEMSDSGYCVEIHEGCLFNESCVSCAHYEEGFPTSTFPPNSSPILNTQWCAGKNDYRLMKRLADAGTDHRKFMRMMPVYIRIAAPLYWWKEFDTYKVGTVANSCSTMHKIADKEFSLEDFSTEHLTAESVTFGLEPLIDILNKNREAYLMWVGAGEGKKKLWWQMIQLLPSSYNQTRNVMLNYEVLANMYKSRKNHKLDEWHIFCDWIETLPYSELITGQPFKNIPICDDMVEAINRSSNVNAISSKEPKTDEE
jgi:hypothetical protein